MKEQNDKGISVLIKNKEEVSLADTVGLRIVHSADLRQVWCHTHKGDHV